MVVVDPAFWDCLQQRFSRPSEPGVLRDALDGSEYKKHHRFVNQPCNVTFTLNTDGVSLFRSSSVDLWPIWLAVNELPPTVRYVCVYSSPFPLLSKQQQKTNCCIYTHSTTYMIRFKRKNLLLAGLWFGRSKPTMSTFLKPLMDHLKTLSSRGTFPIRNLVHVTCMLHAYDMH